MLFPREQNTEGTQAGALCVLTYKAVGFLSKILLITFFCIYLALWKSTF
jgi:hypothetical protein